MQGKLVEQRSEEGTGEELYQKIQKEKPVKKGKTKKQMPLPPITEKERPFEIPRSWRWVYIGDIFQHNTGKALNGASGQGKMLTYITTSNLYWNRFEFTKLKEMPFTEAEIEKCTVKKNDLLVCEGGDFGRAAIWTNDKPMRIQNHIHRLRAYYAINIKFYYLIFLFYKNSGFISGKGIGIQGLSSNALHKLIVPLPPLLEQIRIVAKLEELMPFVDRYATAYDKLQSYTTRFPNDLKKSILQQAIQGKLIPQDPNDEPASVLFEKITKEKEKLVKEGKIKKQKPLPEITEDEIPFEIPESWKWVRLNDVVVKNIKRGRSPSYAAKSHTLVLAQKCNTKAGYIDMSLAKYLNESKLPNYSTEEFMEDKDIVLNSTGNGTLGRVGIFRSADNPSGLPIVPDSHVTVIRITSLISSSFAFYYLHYYQPYMEKLGSGSTNQTELSTSVVQAILFPLPPLSEQRRIVAKIEKFMPLVARYATAYDKLQPHTSRLSAVRRKL